MSHDLIQTYHGDCFLILKELPSKSVDLVITDPPYLHNTSRSGGGNTKLATSSMYAKEGEMLKNLSNFSPGLCVSMLDEIKRLMKKMSGYFFCNDRLIGTYCKWAEDNKYLINMLTWNKPLSILNRMRYSTNCEYIVWIHEASGTALNKIDLDSHPEYKKYYSKYQTYSQVRGKEKYHPTQKPLELIEGYILLSSKEGNTVLDPFMGSGTTGVAAIKHNRKFIGIELDTTYSDIANSRLQDVVANIE